MLITINKTRLKLVGDPHLGRKFEEGVPLHRRGEREAEQMKQFEQELLTPDVDMNVMMGDIFDKFTVSPTVVLQTYLAYCQAVAANPETIFVLLMGNHDVSRNVEVKSSFDLLEAMLKYLPNVHVVKELEFLYGSSTQADADLFAFFPYNVFAKAGSEIGEGFDVNKFKVEAAFGHWDLHSFGGSDHNLIPTKELAQITTKAFSGHIHKPETFVRDGVEVVGTGSMQPYAHGEDAGNNLYVSVTLSELEAALSQSPEAFADKCVRVLLAPGETLPPNIECRQLTSKPLAQNADNEAQYEVMMENFSFETIVRSHFATCGLTTGDADEVMDKYETMTNTGE